MTEEIKIEQKEETCKCFCKSEFFRKFLVITLGSFVGVFSALSLFAALHKPPMIKPVPYGMKRPCYCQMHHFHKGGPRGDFHRKMVKRDFQRLEKRDFGQKPPARPERIEK